MYLFYSMFSEHAPPLSVSHTLPKNGLWFVNRAGQAKVLAGLVR